MSVILSYVLMVSGTVCANLLLKAGAMVAPTERTFFGLVDWRTAVGFAFFAFSGVIYSWVLGRLPLNVAVSIAAAQFVAVIVASAVVLGEPIPPVRLAGIALITAGIVLVSSTYARSAGG